MFCPVLKTSRSKIQESILKNSEILILEDHNLTEMEVNPREWSCSMFLWWLDMAGCQVPTKPLHHSPSSTGQGKENTTKGSWVEIRTGRWPTIYRHRQSRFSSGKLV